MLRASIPAAALGELEHVAVEAWPTLFAFQFLYEPEPPRSRELSELRVIARRSSAFST
jgi:hypothetical protein